MNDADFLPVAVRGYAVPAKRRGRFSAPKRKQNQRSSWVLSFDTETDTETAAQPVLYACYRVERDRQLFSAGIAYDGYTLTQKELRTIRRFTVENMLDCIDLDEFRERVFYRYAHDLRAATIGANLFFDLGRLALDHTLAKFDMRGGFSPTISRNSSRPAVRMKKLTARGAKFDFQSSFKRSNAAGDVTSGPWRGYFVDVLTAGNATVGGRQSLETLGKLLNVEHPKLPTPVFRHPVSPKQLEYAVRDPLTTIECYYALEERYAALELPTPLNHIYSEASISKAYLQKIGIRPWLPP